MSFALFIDQDLTEKTGKILTFLVTMASMTLGFTLIPLLPAPLPIIVAFLTAYAVYRNTPVGASAGSMVIGFGLFYHLARIGFFQLFPNLLVRVSVMAVLILPFLVVPAMLADNLAVIAMDMGIISVCMLFFNSTFYLAVPLILIYATIYRKRGILITLSYYIFISIPLQVMQYLKTFELGIPPPLYSPLDIIYKDIQESMSRVSFTEIKNVLRVIGGQMIKQTENGGLLDRALANYIDSLPGMFLFLVIISGLVSATAILTIKLPKAIKRTSLSHRYYDVLVYLLPTVAASVTNVMFFILLDNLQHPLAFNAVVNPSILMASTGFTMAISTPVSLSKYIMDLRVVLVNRTEELERKAEDLCLEVRNYIRTIEQVGDPTPDPLSALKTRLLIIEDELNDMVKRASERNMSLKEVNSNLRRMFVDLKVATDYLHGQLSVALDEYYIKIKFEYLEAIGEIRELGLDVEPLEVPDLPADSSPESKIPYIEQVVESGRVLVENLIETADKIYEIICSLFEPSKPRDSPIIQISREKMWEDEPWVVIDAILASLKNWERQYSEDIVNSTKPIQDAIETIIELSKREDILLPILGERFNLIKAISSEMEEREEFRMDDENLKVLKVILIREDILSTVDVVAKVIGILHHHLLDLENTIEALLPVEEYEWNRNPTLADRMKSSSEVITNYESYEIDDIVSHLYRALSYIDEAVDTIEYYNEKKEMFLNYRVLEKKIDRILKERDEVRLEDLGVSEKYGREYLKLYHRSHLTTYPLEETGDSLRRTP